MKRVLKNLVLATFFIAVGLFFINTSSAKAQNAEDAYQYKASSGDNLSYVVRDAINQYCNANDVKLNAAQRMYAETNIVNDMGAYWLDVNQDVNVSKQKVKDYSDSAQNLDSTTQAAWQKYADTTSIQSVIDGGKTNVQQNKEASDAAAQAQSASENGQSNSQQSTNDQNSDQSDQNSNDDNESKNEQSSNSGFWTWIKDNWAKLVLVALIATLIYRIVNRPSDKA